MASDTKGQQSNKTHEQFLRNLERKDDFPKEGEARAALENGPAGINKMEDRDARQSEMPVSRQGMNQESRDHNKHNNPGQSGNKPQKHSPAEEKH